MMTVNEEPARYFVVFVEFRGELPRESDADLVQAKANPAISTFIK
jgi:hypothetical protein